jgi:hypothetical protein
MARRNCRVFLIWCMSVLCASGRIQPLYYSSNIGKDVASSGTATFHPVPLFVGVEVIDNLVEASQGFVVHVDLLFV